MASGGMVLMLAENAEGRLDLLDRALDGLRDAALLDPATFHRVGARFHVTLVEPSGSRTLSALIGMLSDVIERELANTLAELGPDSDEARRANRRRCASYEDSAASIPVGDGKGAEKTWRAHMSAFRQFLGSAQREDQILDVLY